MRQSRQAELNTTAERAPRLTGRTRAVARAAIAVALGGLGAGLLAPSSIAASKKAAASPSVIHACYKNKTGALRVVSAGRRCGSGEVAISWVAAGVAGPRGPAGEAGSLLGPRGVAGQVGPEGPAGAPGPQGQAAVRGVAGATGPRGATGPPGPPGEKGANGTNGPTGAAGTNGVNGATGATGTTGPTGTAGPPGPIGPAGQMGEPLPPGVTETGAWIATSGAAAEAGEPGKPREVAGTISFPVPLATAPTKVHYLNSPQTNTGTGAPPECPSAGKVSEALEHPKAEKGTLCVYTGKEVLESSVPGGVSFENIQNVAGETEKASATGAFVVFAAHVTPVGNANEITVQGTWAVTG